MLRGRGRRRKPCFKQRFDFGCCMFAEWGEKMRREKKDKEIDNITLFLLSTTTTKNIFCLAW